MQTFDEKLEVFNEAKRTGRTVMAKLHGGVAGEASWSQIDEEAIYWLAPETITVNGVEVPAPMSKKPEIDQCYFTPNIFTPNCCSSYKWDDATWEITIFDRGFCFKSKEDVTAYVKALGWIE